MTATQINAPLADLWKRGVKAAHIPCRSIVTRKQVENTARKYWLIPSELIARANWPESDFGISECAPMGWKTARYQVIDRDKLDD